MEALVDSSVSQVNQLKHVQSPLQAPEEAVEFTQSQGRGRKRKREPEEEGLDTRRPAPPPPPDEPAIAPKPLSKKNLAELNMLNRRKELETVDDMAGKKRSLSRRSSVTGDSGDNTTTVSAASVSASVPKSSLSLSNYRLINLDLQRIVFEHDGVPKHVQTRLDSIFQSETSEEDEQKIDSIARAMCKDFAQVLKAACREDDSVELICRALESMNKELLGEVFAFRRKAGKKSKTNISYRY